MRITLTLTDLFLIFLILVIQTQCADIKVRHFNGIPKLVECKK